MADLIKISDSTSTTSSVVAASSTAVKAAYDRGTAGVNAAATAQTAADNAASAASNAQTSANAAQSTADSALAAAEEAKAAAENITVPVTSVNGQTGAVTVGTVRSVNGVSADAAGNVAVSKSMSFPDYSAGVSKTWNTSYTAEVDGWIYAYGRDSNAISEPSLIVGSQTFTLAFISAYVVESGILVPVAAGVAYKGSGGEAITNKLIFYPCK